MAPFAPGHHGACGTIPERCDDLRPGTRIGAFEILGTLGEGGMGAVFRARDLTLKREVALKLLPQAWSATGSSASHAGDERHARFEREAQALAALNQPNIAVEGNFDRYRLIRRREAPAAIDVQICASCRTASWKPTCSFSSMNLQ